VILPQLARFADLGVPPASTHDGSRFRHQRLQPSERSGGAIEASSVEGRQDFPRELNVSASAADHDFS
jgi:hypothetical protein